MASTDVAGNSARHATTRFASLSDLFAGTITSILAVMYGLSFAALIFSGPLTPWLAYSIAAAFLTSAIAALIVAARGSIPFMIAGPDGSTAAVTATLVATLAERMAAAGMTELHQPALIVMGIAALLTGLLLCILGLARAGSAIRFIPYPVIGGFLGATGWLMVNGAVRVITDMDISLEMLPVLTTPSNLAKLAAGGVVAIALFFGLRRGRSPFVLPAVLLGSLVAAHVVMLLTGTSLLEAESTGWMFTPPNAVGMTIPWISGGLSAFPWAMLPAVTGDILAVMFVTAISMLLNTTGIEFVTRREANLGRDLNTLGIANIVSGAAGGFVSCMSLSRTTVNYQAGGRGRLGGFIVAGVSLLMLGVNPHFIAYVPKFVLGGLLIYLGCQLMYAWLVDAARRLSWLEYVSLLAIAFLIVQWGFIAGVLIGVIIGCATFAVSASRVNAIKFSFDGSEYRSSLDRNPEELAVLARHGQEIQGMSLQSYLFFGSANRLYQQVKALFARRPECRVLLLDMRLVTGIDSSAMHSFTQIKQATDEIGAKLVLVNLTRELRNVFRNSGLLDRGVILAPDLDRALEACEEEIIAAYLAESRRGQSLHGWLTQALGSGELAEQLATYLKRIDVGQDETVATQGARADSMHFILEGRVGVIVTMDDGRKIRVRSLGQHTTIGEMGLITKQQRSATIQAEVPSVLYALSTDAYERIKTENQPLAQALLTYIVTVMAERLSFASRLIGVLRR